MSDDLSGFSMMDLFRMEAEERLTVLSQGLVAARGIGASTGSDRAPHARGPLAEKAARVAGRHAPRAQWPRMEDSPGRGTKRYSGVRCHRRAAAGVDLLTQMSQVSEGESGAGRRSRRGVERLEADLTAIQQAKVPSKPSAIDRSRPRFRPGRTSAVLRPRAAKPPPRRRPLRRLATT